MARCDTLRELPESILSMSGPDQARALIASYNQSLEAYSVCAKRQRTLVEWIEHED